MRKHIKSAVALLIPVILAGCIASGTFTIIFDLDEFVSSSSGMEVVEVNLAENDTYNDHKDQIKSIDQVTVTGWFINLEPQDNQAEIWLSYDGTYTTPAEVRSNATRVFMTPVIPGGDSLLIEWSDGLSHIENLAIGNFSGRPAP